ncbi:MAG TPA: choice-of-anchor tandem repeat GloVer-containing protein, partial [Chthoniobacterales bacterium]
MEWHSHLWRRSAFRVFGPAILLLSISGGQVTAQTFTTLRSLGGNDGGQPLGKLTLSGSTLYGTASNAGSNANAGTVFAINSDGTGFRAVHTFNSGSTDGARPSAGLVLSGNRLFGTTAAGGASGLGTVFALNTDGTGFTLLHSFAGAGQGADAEGDLILSGNTLYGTARFSSGGNSPGDGIVFAVNTDGTGFRIVHSFSAATDGAQPVAGLVLLGNVLFGTASTGGNAVNGGTVFAVNTDGTGFFVLHRFGGIDGVDPESGLTLSGSTLFGTTVGGGNGNQSQGTIFAVNTDGTGFHLLRSFVAASDGSLPRAGLTLSGNTLYGTTTASGPSRGGTIFSINTDGTKFTVLHPFTSGGIDGFNPGAEVLVFGNALFGTTEVGGTFNAGTVFRFSQGGILSPLAANSTIGQLFVYQIVSDNKPTSYDAFGLPPDLTIDTTTGIISGVPTQSGLTPVTISATGASGTQSGTLNITIKPQPASGPVITSTNSATGRPGQFFAFQVLVHGATAAARASATGLPTGLQIDDVSGLISGTPASSGSFAVNITITDGKLLATQTLELTFTSDSAIPVITSPSTAALTPGRPFSYTMVAPTVAPPDPTVFSIDGALPPGLGLDPVTGVISGTPGARSERLQTLTPLVRALDDTPVVGAVQ